MHVTYLRCKSYCESMVHVLYLRVLQDRSAENYRPVSSCSIHCRESIPVKDAMIAEDLLEVAGRLPDSAGGQVWSRLLFRVDFVHRLYMYKAWEFKAWFIATTRRARRNASRQANVRRDKSTEMWSMDTKSISDYLTRGRISV